MSEAGYTELTYGGRTEELKWNLKRLNLYLFYLEMT